MTMGDDELFSAMALPVVLGPVLEKLEQQDAAGSQSLRTALTKVETHYPGFTFDLISGILSKAEVQQRIDMNECFLRMEGINNSTEFRINRSDESLRTLNERAVSLKQILSRIPDEIFDRRRFLETIKDIASAIRLLLDSVNAVFAIINSARHKQVVEQRKREFVRYSRRFSNTLKDFFRDSGMMMSGTSLQHQNSNKPVIHCESDIQLLQRNRKQQVFLSANHLVNQTNLLMKSIKEAID